MIRAILGKTTAAAARSITTTYTDLLPAVHILGRRLDGLNFIDGVLRVDVLPVLTVGAVAAALPVSPAPGAKTHRSQPVTHLPIGMQSV